MFEGIDGSGKTSQIARLANYIRGKDKYRDVLLTREPTWRASELRTRLSSDGDAFSDGEKMARLFVQDRKMHYERQIAPALEQKAYVLCDRYALSTCAYQATQGVPLETLLALHEEAGIRRPDMTFFIDVSRDIAEARMVKRGEAKEKFENNAEFREKLIEMYRTLIDRSIREDRLQNVIGPVALIDGNDTINAVEAKIKTLYDFVYAIS